MLKGRILQLCGGLVAFTAGWYSVRLASAVPEHGRRGVVVREADEMSRDHGRSAKDEIVLVFVGSPTCPFATKRDMRQLVGRAIHSLEGHRGAVGGTSGQPIFTIGIAKTQQAGKGLRYLRGIADFDEYLSGGGWLNTGVQKYIFTDFQGRPATPQVLVLSRTVLSRPVASVKEELVILRKVGLAPMRAWVEAGAPLSLVQQKETPQEVDVVGR